MLDTFKDLIANQFEAAYCALNACINKCPRTAWDAPVGNLAFCQVALHTLFYADYYLGEDAESLRQQLFHRDNQDFFGDYEELLDRRQESLYDRASIKLYLAHCRDKAASVIAAETVETLNARSGFERWEISRAELHVHNIRHIQHHVAQLSLRLRINFKEDIPWISSGWRELKPN